MAARIAGAEQMKPMDPAEIALRVRARLAQGPCSLSVLMAALVPEKAATQLYLPDGPLGVLAVMHMLATLGEVSCTVIKPSRKGSLTLVWTQRADKPELRRRDDARRARWLKPPEADQPRMIVTAIEARGGHDSDDEAPEPMEVLARLAGCTAYKEPGHVYGSLPGTTSDEIDFVLAGVSNRLGADMAFTIACGSRRNWHSVHRLGYPRILDVIGEQRGSEWRDLLLPEKRARVRMVFADVFNDAAEGRRRRTLDDMAKAANMRSQTYRRVYDLIAHELMTLATDAAEDAIDRLYNRDARFSTSLVPHACA